MRIKFIILLIILPILLFAESFKSIYFNGAFIYDEESGISIIPAENKEVIVVTNLNYHYAIILPYAINWEITFNDKYVLLASNKTIDVTLELIRSDNKTSEEFLKNLLQMYLNNKEKYYIIEAKIFRYNSEYILATVIDAKLLMNDDKYEGIKQINYFATKIFKDERFNLCMSFMQKKNKAELENNAMFDYLTLGFNVDYERNTE